MGERVWSLLGSPRTSWELKKLLQGTIERMRGNAVLFGKDILDLTTMTVKCYKEAIEHVCGSVYGEFESVMTKKAGLILMRQVSRN